MREKPKKLRRDQPQACSHSMPSKLSGLYAGEGPGSCDGQPLSSAACCLCKAHRQTSIVPSKQCRAIHRKHWTTCAAMACHKPMLPQQLAMTPAQWPRDLLPQHLAVTQSAHARPPLTQQPETPHHRRLCSAACLATFRPLQLCRHSLAVQHTALKVWLQPLSP